ncbi:MAG TPA: sigma-70 family RNA polymerase sigma factor [Saprospiraceae bacterium]|nr:sigma-70 family RNA polymerase sigma factor [Saprospiraceae bacterium]HMP13050.1 sigma-70 family RNA polymerase sigma factor [Saprospiraceae bacterium]
MEQSEKTLVEACLRQDAAAQRALYEQYKVPMFQLCLRYAQDREEAEDLLQEGFIRVFQDLRQYRGEGTLGAWIRRLMINVALQHIRRKKRLFPTVDLEAIADSYESDEVVFADLRVKALTQLIQQLPPGYRTVFNLFVIEGYSHQEIATQLQISESTSKTQLLKAKAMLRKMLEISMISVAKKELD